MTQRSEHAAEAVQDLTERGLTVEEVASYLNCAPSTIYRNFEAELKQGRFLRDSSLRKKQMEVALGGNPTMLIWLGKQLLGQKDQKEISGTINHEHFDLSKLSDESLREVARLVESAATGAVGSEG